MMGGVEELTRDDIARTMRRVVKLDNGCWRIGKQAGKAPTVTIRSKRYYARYVALRAAGRMVPEGEQAIALGSCVSGCINPNHMIIGPRKGATFRARANRGGRPVGVVEKRPRKPYYRRGQLVSPRRDREVGEDV